MLALSVLIGRLGRDPEVRTTQSGQDLARLSLATSRRVKRDEEWAELTEWHDVTLWGQPATFAGEAAKKGDLVLVVGEPRSRSWEDAQGSKRTAHEVVVGGPQHVFKRLAGTGEGATARDEAEQPREAAPAQREGAASPAPRQARPRPVRPMAELAEDIPF
jgi:single-strand DNA-binding protein